MNNTIIVKLLLRKLRLMIWTLFNSAQYMIQWQATVKKTVMQFQVLHRAENLLSSDWLSASKRGLASMEGISQKKGGKVINTNLSQCLITPHAMKALNQV